MSHMELDRPALRHLVRQIILGDDFRRATFAGVPRSGNNSPWRRVVIRPVVLRGGRYLQFACFDQRKCITRNLAGADLESQLDELLALDFSGIHLSTAHEEIDLQTTKKGKILLGRRKVAAAQPEPPAAHNRVKDVPLPEGRGNRLLEVMGILTRAGQVKPSMRPKFTQINEFLKHFRHVLDDAGLRQLGRPVEILDCGCGASYLTLAVHHFLNDILGIPARILGVDVNEAVIRQSLARAERLGAGGLSFACGRIDAVTVKADVVLALHACDTATDDALAQAVRSEARLVLSVPCCHHALNQAIRPVGPTSVLRPLLRHGILQQRTADIVTDAFRALALRIMGYRTDVVEFVSPEHTARNLMIRAVRGAPPGDEALLSEYRELCRFWGVTPYIEQALGDPFQRLLEQR